MFLSQFSELRASLLHESRLVAIADLGTGAFSSRSMDDVISTSLVVSMRSPNCHPGSAIQAGPLTDPRRDAGKPLRRHAAVLAHETRFDFDPRAFVVIEGEPIVYWWPKELLHRYAAAPKVGAVAPVRQGMATTDNTRFLRQPWEPYHAAVWAKTYVDKAAVSSDRRWVPYIKGAAGAAWLESLSDLLNWKHHGA